MSEPRLLGERYELGEVIGRGGMAEVRRGRDTRLGRVVALKMLRVDHATDATFQARFRREAQSAASLNHRHIVAVYDTGEDMFDGQRIPYIVMEYVEGHTLREMVHDRARFTPERASEVISATLDALEYSHRAGIVHRDIKPGNIMITTGGEVKVMDFGIARSLADTGMALTQTAAVVGTAQYISPEQARGEQADARSDLYATGCVLYELLTGRPPFVGESLVSVAVSHVREYATPPSALDPSIPRDLDSIVMKSLAKDRLDRYQSAHDMRSDLQRAAAGLPVAAAADTSAATQLIAPAAPMGAYDDAVPLDDEPVGDDDRRRFSWWAVALGSLAVLAIAGLIGFLLFRPDASPQATVPNLVGATQEQAEQQLEQRNLTADVQNQPTNKADEVGKVLSQKPPPNTRVDEDTPVTINVGTAPDAVAVPAVTGRSLEEAEKLIRDAGLTPGNRVAEPGDEEANTVLRTDPPGGTSVAPETSITIYYSTGEAEILVPDLTGKSRAEAEFELTRLKLVPRFQEEPAGDRPIDQVVRQTPAPNTPLKEGDEVFVVVTVESDEPTEDPTTEPPTDDPTTGTDSGQDTGGDPGTDTGQDTGGDPGTDTGQDTGGDTGGDWG